MSLCQPLLALSLHHSRRTITCLPRRILTPTSQLLNKRLMR
jgi:hypothetical protein